MVKFRATKNEYKIISMIVKRAVAMARDIGDTYTPMDAHMDITACHSNGCALNLLELAKADDFNFAHDVFGIRRHINRTTGKLKDCFLPRYAL